MGKKPLLGWIGTFGFGLALASGGCETCSNNPKRTFTPTPPVTRNTTGPTTPATGTATGPTQPGTGTTSVNNGGFNTPPKSGGIQPVGATVDPIARTTGTTTPITPLGSDLRVQPAVVKETSNRITVPDMVQDPVAPPPPPPPQPQRRTAPSVGDLAPGKVSSPSANNDGLLPSIARSDEGGSIPPPPPRSALGSSVYSAPQPPAPQPPAPQPPAPPAPQPPAPPAPPPIGASGLGTPMGTPLPPLGSVSDR